MHDKNRKRRKTPCNDSQLYFSHSVCDVSRSAPQEDLEEDECQWVLVPPDLQDHETCGHLPLRGLEPPHVSVLRPCRRPSELSASFPPSNGASPWNSYPLALVFPRSGASDLLKELRELQRGGQTDALIEKYADRTAFERFALAPRVVQHVGLISNRNNLEINTKSTWVFWFAKRRVGVSSTMST